MKRLFDIVFSAAGLVILSPLLLLIGYLLRRQDRGPVFYRGMRVGRYGDIFRIFKYRTMVVDGEKMGPSSTTDEDPRVTNIGRFLRKYKLDELPQLLNVLRGEMSIVGPRPQVQWAVDLYSPQEKGILTVRPGITDYASLRFRSEGEILTGSENPDRDYLEKIHPEKMRLSLHYVRDRSILLDIKLILKTLRVVFGR